jgi:murein DD-endopeptidase MepM/ murein hydrolase activator NlpD
MLVFVLPTSAALVDELKGRISDKTSEIQKIEAEIAKYQKEIDSLGGEADTLKNSIHKLNVTRKKLQADIRYTQAKINSSTSKIEKLARDITEKSTDIKKSNEAIGEIIRKIDEAESSSLLEVVLSNDTFSSFLDDIENLKQLQSVVRQNLKKLEKLKSDLEVIKSKSELQKRSLVNSRSELSDRKQITESNKKKKDRLLRDTKNKESNYKKLLSEKQKLREEYERELQEIESQLRAVIEPGSIPSAGSGIFMPPLPDVAYSSCYNGSTKAKNCITQQFGKTVDAVRLYKSGTHNGTDFRASIGTKVKAVLGGTVVEVGNTDKFPKCLSYGKWVLVKHNNGLSTLYAHLNLIKVNAGQEVNTGDVIGYSGNSGYSTGPHLHLTTYATAGVKVVRLGDIKSRTNCANARIPVAPFNAYLNSLDYL